MLVYVVVIAWSVYLGMWLLSRRQRRSMNSISTFAKHLAVLGKATPAGRHPGLRGVPSAPPVRRVRSHWGMSLDDARNRRRQILTALAGAASLTAFAAFVAGGVFVPLHLLCDLLVVGYVGLLVRTQKLAADRRSKVVYLPMPVLRDYEPQLLRRTAD